MITKRLLPTFLLSIVALIFSGCEVASMMISPTEQALTVAPLLITPTQPSPIAMPPYIHYTPSETSNTYLEFDYPGSWLFNEQKREAGIIIISLADPRFRTLPTPIPDYFYPTPNDYGSVDILIRSLESGQTLDTLVESHKKGFSAIGWITALHEYKTTLHGHEASVFEYQIEFPELYTSVMFERDIFFAVNDQVYQITFVVAEKDRGGEFEQGYEYFYNSLEIVP